MVSKKRGDGILGVRASRSFIKVAAVILRDHSHLRLDEVLEQFILCWRRTESVAESEKRYEVVEETEEEQCEN